MIAYTMFLLLLQDGIVLHSNIYGMLHTNSLALHFKLLLYWSLTIEFMHSLHDYFQWWDVPDTFVIVPVFLLYLPQDDHIRSRNILEDTS